MFPKFLLPPLLLSTVAMAGPAVRTPHVEAELISRHSTFQPGKPIEAALRLRIIDHWHTYWRNPGDSGLPTRIAWSLPEGYSAGEIAWPHPKRLPLGPLTNYGYEGQVLHLVDIATPTAVASTLPVTLRAKAEWLVCSDVCIPETAELSLSLRPARAGGPVATAWEPAFQQARDALPQRLADDGTASIANGKLVLAVKAKAIGPVQFYPYREDLIAHADPQSTSQVAAGTRVEVRLQEGSTAPPPQIDGVLVAEGGWDGDSRRKAIEIAVPVVASVPSATQGIGHATGGSMTIGFALLSAFIGGLLLNLMPCVFPVLGIKVMGFAAHSAATRQSLRLQGVAFLGGVLLSFWVLAATLLAIKAGGVAVGWGFQLQSPAFVTMLAMLFMLMGLNLAGVFEIGLAAQRAAGAVESRGNGLANAFLSGILATVVATPCTAPFMGAALGFTLTQPPAIAMLVFTALALGMALPVVLLSWHPAWIARLPRPGAWMQTLKQFLAFPLFATVAWLAWVLGSQAGNDAVASLLMALVLVAMGAWVLGRWQSDRPALSWAIAIAALAAGLVLAWPPADGGNSNPSAKPAMDAAWLPFSPARIAELRADGKPVFVDFTATWCITCQVNKRVALARPEVEARFAALGVTRMKADWSKQDPVITAALAEFGRTGVPLYVYYPPKGEAIVLSEVLTPGEVLAALGTPPPTVATR